MYAASGRPDACIMAVGLGNHRLGTGTAGAQPYCMMTVLLFGDILEK